MLYWYVNRDEDSYFNINLVISDPIKVNIFLQENGIILSKAIIKMEYVSVTINFTVTTNNSYYTKFRC